MFGLPIVIENPKGSKRHWYDPHCGETGSTHMYYSYGYIDGVQGVDGDELDVYVGPSARSQRVFVVTQLKKPDFKEIDEQKVMLGFDTIEQAREAYLYQYDDPRFLHSIKELSLPVFKLLILTMREKGELIKALRSFTISAKIPDVNKSAQKSVSEQLEKLPEEKQLAKDDEEEKDMSKSLKPTELLKSVAAQAKKIAEEPLPEVNKALKASVVSGFRQAARVAEYEAQAAREAGIGIQRTRPTWEPPVVPVRHVDPPAYTGEVEVYKSCDSCGYVHKSVSDCPRCEHLHNTGGEAKHFRLTGR